MGCVPEKKAGTVKLDFSTAQSFESFDLNKTKPF